MIQPCLLYYVKHVFVILNSFFLSKIYIRKGRRSVSKQDHPQPHVHSKERTHQAHNCKMAYCQHVVLLVQFDLSAAFDTVEHSTVLLSRLSKSFGIGGTALERFASYLSNRLQRVSLNRDFKIQRRDGDKSVA